MIASEQGMSSAAPTPWTARAPISVAISGAQPQPIEASVKVMTPVRKSTRRPKRSAAAPPINSSADMHSVYALMTHCIAASVVPRSASIVGSATLTTDSSTNAMVDPNTAAASTQGLSSSGQADLPRVERMTYAAQGCVFEVITCCRSGRVRGSHRPAAPLPPRRPWAFVGLHFHGDRLQPGHQVLHVESPIIEQLDQRGVDR